MNLFSLLALFKVCLVLLSPRLKFGGGLLKNSIHCRATRQTLPPPQLFSQFFYSYSLLAFINAIVSPQPMKGAQFSKWIPAG